MIVVVAALKGGVGKTTTSVYLVALAARGDECVTVIDADRQASAAEWLDTAEDARLRSVDLVEAPTERLVTKALASIQDDEVAIVDTPPGQERLLSKATSTADVVVVPTRVGGVESARVEAVLDLIPSKTAAGLVVCSARQHTLDHKDSVRTWKEARVPIWGTIPERVAIASGPEARLLSWEGLRAYREVWDQVRRAVA